MTQPGEALTGREREELKRCAALGAVQTLVAKHYSTAVGIAYGVTMARLLDPKDFGLMALSAFFLMLSMRVREFSLNEILIQKQGDEDKLYSTHWTTQLALGGFQLVVVLCGLPVLNAFYSHSRVGSATLTGVMAVLLIGELLTIGSSTPFTVLRKKMRFKHLAILEVGGTTIAAGTGLALALNGFGVWSLAVGRIAPALLRFVYCWVLHPWKLSFAFNAQVAQSFFKLGVYLWLIQTTIFVTYSAGDLLVGSLIGLAALGFYSKAFHLAMLPVEILTGVLATVTYPVYCRLQNSRKDMGRALGRVLSTVFRFTVPVSLGMMLVGGEFIEIVLGEKWLPAAPLLKVMALYTVLRSVFDDTGRVFLALGKPNIPAALRLIQSAFQLGVCYLLVRAHGALGASISADLAVLAGFVLNCIFLHRLVHIPFKQIFFYPVICGVVAALGVTALAAAVGPMGLYARFFLKGTSCVVIYFGLLYLIARKELISEAMLLKTAFAARRSK